MLPMGNKTGRASDALVAVHEGVVLDQEVEQVRGLLLQARVEVAASEGLHHGAQGALKPLVFLPPEQGGAMETPSVAVVAKNATTATRSRTPSGSRPRAEENAIIFIPQEIRPVSRCEINP
jgi:hypothetical protein